MTIKELQALPLTAQGWAVLLLVAVVALVLLAFRVSDEASSYVIRSPILHTILEPGDEIPELQALHDQLAAQHHPGAVPSRIPLYVLQNRGLKWPLRFRKTHLLTFIPEFGIVWVDASLEADLGLISRANRKAMDDALLDELLT